MAGEADPPVLLCATGGKKSHRNPVVSQFVEHQNLTIRMRNRRDRGGVL